MDSIHPTPSPAMSRRRKIWIAVAVLVVLALAVQGIVARHLTHSALERDAAVSSVQTVSVITPMLAAASQDLVLPADMRAYADAPIFARVSGYLTKWYVDIGGHVKKGQLLAEVDTPEVHDQLRQAHADEQTAQANYLLAKSTADRWDQMLKSHSVSQQEAEEKDSDMQAKQSALNSARANASRLTQLTSFGNLYAPFDGVVTARNTDVGQLIDAGSASAGRELFHIQDATTLRVYANVPQAYASQVKIGQTAELILNEQAGRPVTGVVVRTAGAVDPVARTLLVEVEVKNPTGELLPGSYAQIRFRLTSGQAGLLLPGNALLFRPGGVRVAVVDAQQHVKLVPVKLGVDYGTRVAIAAGLSGQERVIINPPDAIVDGATVRIVAAPGRAASGVTAASGAAGASAATAEPSAVLAPASDALATSRAASGAAS
ncbi:efflux RND transporter periplasmic adaptor subunit [Burkholderia sp. L27(2015)]|uniref:efflux RND transporter periplasmic adaptor subunit n=1 Tax=Burkholderia sp. L27(2015) TaxID=1641858 RepID=UPI0015775B66|nr:efflux RND transporter periplasmic adaptor subunit [Burkholderia sp. L27(2015)]